MIIGYTNGYYDILHIGHLSTLQKARALCDKLIVGVISDEECQKRKGKTPIIPLAQRLNIIDGLECVDVAVPVYEDYKFGEWLIYRYDYLFVGCDHFGEKIWALNSKGLEGKAKVVFLPTVKHISSTLIKQRIIDEAAQKKTTVS